MKIDTAELVVAAHRRDQFLADGRPEVAFVGRSNVGKSSLLNRLLGRRGLARTGSTPGRTRSVNYFLINRRFYFVDLPGYGYAKAAKSDRRSWAALVEQYFDQARTRVLLMQLIDGKVGATVLDVQAGEYFASLGLEPVIVATKIDKVPRGRRARAMAAIRRRLELADGSQVIPFSAVSGEGMKDVWNGILAHLEVSSGGPQTAGTS